MSGSEKNELNPAALRGLSDTRLDELMAVWFGAPATPSSDIASLIEKMQAQAAKLGWVPMLERLTAGGAPIDCSGSFAFVHLARRLLAGELGFDEVLAALGALELGEPARAVLSLYVSCEPGIVQEALHIGVLRLAADTARDDELAARIYSTLGRHVANDVNAAAGSFDAGFMRIKDADLPALQARLALDLARCLSKLGKGEDAILMAHLASLQAEQGGEPVQAFESTVLHAALLIEAGRPREGAEIIGPLVTRQVEDGIVEGTQDAWPVLSQAIGKLIASLLEDLVAEKVDDPVGKFEAALALAGESRHRLKREPADRADLARALARAGEDELAREQMEIARRGLEGAGQAAPGAVAQFVLHNARLLTSGQVIEATESLAQAVRATAEHPFDSDIAALRNMFAAALQMGGHLDQAQKLLTEIVEQSRAAGLPDAEGAALYALGENALTQRGYDEALGYYQQAARLSEQTGNQAVLGKALNKIGACYVGRREPEQAVEYHRRALTIHRREKVWDAVVVDLIQAAQCLLDLGDLDGAREMARELDGLGPKYPPQDPEWVPFVLGRVQAALGDWTSARSRFRDVLLTIERGRQRYASPDAQRRWSEQKADTYGLIIEAAIQAEAASDAIEFLELARNRYLKALVERRQQRPDRVSAEDWAELEKAQDRLAALREQHYASLAEGEAGVAERLDSARAELARIREALELGDRRPLAEDLDAGSWASIKQAVPHGHTAVWCGGFPRGFGVVAARRTGEGDFSFACRFDRSFTGTDLTRLYEGDLRAARQAHAAGGAVAFLMQLAQEGRKLEFGVHPLWQERHPKEWHQGLDRVCTVLGQKVWPEILAAVGEAAPDLMLLPSVGLSEMPATAAAPDVAAGGSAISLCVAPSLSVLADRDTESQLPPPGELMLGQVVNPSEDPALACSLVEARLVAAACGGKAAVLPGRRATRERVLQSLASQDVFHFLGHAYFDWQDPMQSGLLCAAREGESGLLTMEAILDELGRIHSKLIVLSSCQIGHVPPGDRLNDFLNLPAALVAAGARTVVAPRWQVDDLAASIFVTRLFETWAEEDLTIPGALARTRRWLRDQVTTDTVVAWLERALADPLVEPAAIEGLREEYRAQFEPGDLPFAEIRHWGAFEVTGSPLP